MAPRERMSKGTVVSQMKKIKRESEWLRVYSTDLGEHYESKLVSGNAPVLSESIITRWERFTPEERWEIALALQLRGKLEPEIVPLIDFLLERGDLVTRSTLAPLLPMYPRKQAVVEFLVSELRRERSHRANYFQALALIGDVAAVPALTAIYEGMQQHATISPYEAWSVEEASDFIACCAALWKLTGMERFRSSVEELVNHPNATVKRIALGAFR